MIFMMRYFASLVNTDFFILIWHDFVADMKKMELKRAFPTRKKGENQVRINDVPAIF